MQLWESLSDIFIKYNYELEDISFFIESTLENIKKEEIMSSKDIFKKFTIDMIEGQNSLFLKSVHIFIISFIEAFNREFFSFLRKNKTEFYKKIAGSIPRTNPESIKNFLQKSLKLNVEGECLQWDDFCENLIRRNIIVHKHGEIDQVYIENNKKGFKLTIGMKIGKGIPHDLNYIESLIQNCFHYLAYIFIKTMKYYSIYNEIRKYIKKTLSQFADVDPNFLDFYHY